VPWSIPATVATGQIITAAYGNTYVRDNPAYLKAVIDGTGTDKIPGSALTPGLELANATALPLAGDEAELLRLSPGAQAGLNYNTLRFRLRRDITGVDWGGSSWRILMDIDHGAVRPVELAIGPASINALFGAVVGLSIGSTGVLSGAGFFTSPEIGIVSASTAGIAHGLGSIPRFMGGSWSYASGAAKLNPLLQQTAQVAGLRPELQIVSVDATNIYVKNWESTTCYVVVHAIK
jgi:hypothetical protein